MSDLESSLSTQPSANLVDKACPTVASHPLTEMPGDVDAMR